MSKKVCVIGAGSSGIVAIKTLKSHGLEVVCYEKGSYIGGNWCFQNNNGQSTTYKSLHINTSKQLMAYSDFPMPEVYPDYPHHSLIYKYFEDYVTHFDCKKNIHFNSTVLSIHKVADNNYEVTTDRFGTINFDAVVICNGHHWSPRLVNFEGNFTGKSIHSHDYRSYEGFENKKVLIVGIGNSAVDIACELSDVAEKTTISTRSGAYIVPKYLFGIPTDHISKPPLAYLPIQVQRAALMTSLMLNIGKQDNYGIPTPNRPILSEHPTISQELLTRVGHGKIDIKPNIKKFEEKKVCFTDGSEQEYDIILYCTGYNIKFPFLDKEIIEVVDNKVPLYLKVVPPAHKGLYFIGLIQPLGAVMPLAETQSKWVAQLITGECKLPSSFLMKKSIEDDSKEMSKRYIKSDRHTIQVDFFPYKRRLEQEFSKNLLNIFKIKL